MAKRIIWTKRADRTFTQILEFYIKRNGSKTYSRKLQKEIQSILETLLKQPLLGIKTEKERLRVFIYDNFKIFYELIDNYLIVHLIWDCRQAPEDINL